MHSAPAPAPAGNRYVKYLWTIRVIQDYLCKTADKHRIPKVGQALAQLAEQGEGGGAGLPALGLRRCG